ncbi:MAG: GNAT family N-acetyltransferase [Gammaproteobacteria bacterium]|nr:GNAT family N-acetyltransferase [Gammaproteobacteria bacterium]
MNVYLRRYALLNHQQDIARTAVAIDDAARVFGFYNVATGSIGFDELPPNFAKKGFPKYPVSAVRLARLAVDLTMQGKGLGAALLIGSLERAWSAAQLVGVHIIVVDAKNDKAKAFYNHFGFIELPHSPMTLILPMSTVERLVGK